MALRLIEGFDPYQDINQLGEGRKFRAISPSAISIVAGRYSGRAIRIASSPSFRRGIGLNFDPVSSGTTVFAGFAVRFEGFSGTNITSPYVAGLVYAGAPQIGINMNSAGYPNLVDNNETILATSTTVFCVADRWYYFELVCDLDGSSGTVSLYVNGELACSYTGATLFGAATSVNELFLGNPEDLWDNVRTDYDDVYVADDTGATNNSRLGDSRVETLYPRSTTTNDFALTGAATAHEALDDDSAGPDGGTSYASSGTAADRILLGTTDSLSGVPLSIHGVAVSHISRKEGASTLVLDTVISSGINEDTRTGRTLLDAYTTDEGLYELDPDGSVAWTKAQVEALLFGIEVGS